MFDKIAAPSKGFFYGWWMVAVGCGMRMLGGGFHLYGFTIFFLPITQELGLSRAATSLVFALARAEGAVEGPLRSVARSVGKMSRCRWEPSHSKQTS